MSSASSNGGKSDIIDKNQKTLKITKDDNFDVLAKKFSFLSEIPGKNIDETTFTE